MVLNLNDVRLTKLIVLNRVCQSLWCYKTGMWALTAAARRWTRERRRRTRQRLTDDEGVEGGLMWPHYLAIGQSLPSRNKFVSLPWAVTDRGGHSARTFFLTNLYSYNRALPIELLSIFPAYKIKRPFNDTFCCTVPGSIVNVWKGNTCWWHNLLMITIYDDLDVGNSDGNDGDQWWRSKQSLCSILIDSS